MSSKDFDIELVLLLDAIYLKYHYDFRGYAMASLRRRMRAAMARFGCRTLSQLQDCVLHDATRFLLAQVGLGAELSGAAALAAVLTGALDLGDAKAPCVLVCGAGDDALAPPA